MFSLKDYHRSLYSSLDRYKAGLFQHHPLFNAVDYAWRVEPGSEYTCDMFQGDDPFQTMKTNNKKIGKFSLQICM